MFSFGAKWKAISIYYTAFTPIDAIEAAVYLKRAYKDKILCV